MSTQNISNIKFRDKKYGWKNFHFIVISTDGKTLSFVKSLKTNSFMRGFIQHLYLRLSCHNCPVRSLKSGSDITIADYWGIQKVLPEFYDKNGISLVMVNTDKGKAIYDLSGKNDRETTYAEALAGNPSIERSILPHKKRSLFFAKFHDKPIIPLIDKLTADSLQIRLKNMMVPLLRKVGLLHLIKSLLRK
jgi:hypothetical protein